MLWPVKVVKIRVLGSISTSQQIAECKKKAFRSVHMSWIQWPNWLKEWNCINLLPLEFSACDCMNGCSLIAILWHSLIRWKHIVYEQAHWGLLVPTMPVAEVDSPWPWSISEQTTFSVRRKFVRSRMLLFWVSYRLSKIGMKVHCFLSTVPLSCYIFLLRTYLCYRFPASHISVFCTKLNYATQASRLPVQYSNYIRPGSSFCA